MKFLKTEGIILKRKDFGEADRILTVFTKQSGKISVLAKGVRRITSKRAGNVELLNRSLLYLHQARSFLILTEATTIATFQKIKDNLLLSTTAFHILELVDKLTAENQENRLLYPQLIEVLERLENNPRQILVRAFEAKILSNLGFVTFTDRLLHKLEGASWDEIAKMTITEREATELERSLRYHTEKVIEGVLKSRQVLKKIIS